MDGWVVLGAIGMLGGVTLASLWVVGQVTAKTADAIGAAVAKAQGYDRPTAQYPDLPYADEVNVIPQYPHIEEDDLFMPGSVDEIRSREAGWLPGPQEPPS